MPSLLAATARPEPVPDDRCEQGLVDVPCFSGFATVAGEPLTLYRVPPRATTLPEQALDGDTLRLPLAERFNAAPGEAFTYAAQSSDLAVASVRVEAGVLVVEGCPTPEPLGPGGDFRRPHQQRARAVPFG